LTELDTKQQALLIPIGNGDDTLLGISTLNNNTGVLNALALTEEVREQFHILVKEALDQLNSNLESQGLIAKVLSDTLDLVGPRHLVAILTSDLELYKDLQEVLYKLEQQSESAI
jgi:hypothetical protein